MTIKQIIKKLEDRKRDHNKKAEQAGELEAYHNSQSTLLENVLEELSEYKKPPT